MKKEWYEMSQSERLEYCGGIAAKMGKSPEDVVDMLDRALADGCRTALEAISDPGVTSAVADAAMLIEIASGQRVSAIKRVGWSRNQYPDGWGSSEMMDYMIRVSQGRLRPTDPAPESIRREGEAWALITPGNPIIMEGYARAIGYPLAISDRPNTLTLMEA